MKSRVITKKMISDFEKSIKAWKPTKETMDISHVYHNDRVDLREVLKAIKDGDYKTASEKAYHLDTVVRDQIPTEIYDRIMGSPI